MHLKQNGKTAAAIVQEHQDEGYNVADLADVLRKAGSSLWTLAQNQHWEDCNKLLARRGQAPINLDETSTWSSPCTPRFPCLHFLPRITWML
jgi:hypothetical protein